VCIKRSAVPLHALHSRTQRLDRGLEHALSGYTLVLSTTVCPSGRQWSTSGLTASLSAQSRRHNTMAAMMTTAARVASTAQLRTPHRCSPAAAAPRTAARPQQRRLRCPAVASSLSDFIQPTPDPALVARAFATRAGPMQTTAGSAAPPRGGDVMGDALQLLLKQRIVFLGSQVGCSPIARTSLQHAQEACGRSRAEPIQGLGTW
jgi:hypothetical protein